MDIALRMTREQFFDWAPAQDLCCEFDGFQPIVMTGGTINYSQMTQNVHFALRTRLRGSACGPLGPDAGVATVGDGVRYPDAVITCTKTLGTLHLIDNPLVAFEVLSPTSGRTDRILKLREHRAVPTIRRHVIVEHGSIGLSVCERAAGDEDWPATVLTGEDILRMPEIDIEIPVAEFYENVDLPDAIAADATSKNNT
jgi:Uma2 family endonuclease